MPKRKRLEQGMSDLRAGVERIAGAIRATAGEGSGEVRINRAGRTSIAIAGTTGEAGSHEAVSSRQTTYIRQHDGETVEETTTQSTSSSGPAEEGP